MVFVSDQTELYSSLSGIKYIPREGAVLNAGKNARKVNGPSAPIIPRPPAFETAEANFHPEHQIIPP